MANYNVAKKPKQKQKAQKPPAAGPSIDDGNMTPQQKALEALYGKQGSEGGQALIDTYLQPGSLGRVSTDLSGQKAYLDQLKGGLEGYTAPEYQGQREQMERGVSSDLATSLATQARSQARGKVYGAAATAQSNNLIQGANDNKDNLEQQLMVKNIDEKQTRLNQYGSQLGAYDAASLDREKTNLSQEDAEKAAQISAFTGAAGQGLLKSQIAAANAIQKKGLQKLG